jgi:hypothetical protein
MVVRPSDWFLVDLGSDPTPGDAFGIRALAVKYSDIAVIAGEASDGVLRARTSGAASAWIGDAGDIFREKSHRMPGELAKANDSYSLVAEALRVWAESVDDTQAQADRGLQQAREAYADLSAAQAALGSAQSSWSTVHAQQLTYQKLTKDYASVPPPANVTMPTDYQLRSADRSAQQAHTSIAAAQSRIADADARLAAAKALVHAAKERRDDAERTVVHKIGAAQDHAVKPSSIWEAIQSSAAWQAFVQIATIVLTIVTIVAIFLGGPLVWALILAATILLVANALLSIAQGKDAWVELALLAVGLIPGGRLLGLAAKGVDAVSRMGIAGEHLAAGVGAMTTAVRSGTGLVTHVVGMAGERLADFASAVPNGVLKAIHSGSADPATLAALFKEHYGDLLEVNQANYLTGANQYLKNCTRCVIAVEHTLDGVGHAAQGSIAAPISYVAKHLGETGTMKDWSMQRGYESIVSTLTDLGEGARGVVYGGRADGTAHVFNVVHDSNGIVFLDGQSGSFAELEPFEIIGLLISKAGTP